MAILPFVALSGCAGSSNGQSFSVYFQPYSANLDQQALTSIQAATDFANANPTLPVALAGYAAPPDPNQDVEGLSANRAAAVKQTLINDGVRADRVTTVANGITDPKSLPTVAVRRVDITIGR